MIRCRSNQISRYTRFSSDPIENIFPQNNDVDLFFIESFTFQSSMSIRNFDEFLHPTMSSIHAATEASSVDLGRPRASRRRPVEAQPTVGGWTSRRMYTAPG